ncbi:MAG: hypothetical protein J6X98_02150 [Bacteroidales bacterium]|nr:hypothetical protein [Bacteroidales bacterium]
MRYLRCAIGLLSFLCCVNILLGQNVVTGKYKGHIVKMKFYKGSPDDIQYLEYGLVTELNKTVTRLEKEKSSLQKELNKLKGKTPVQDDSLQMELIIKERDLLARERTIDSLNERVDVISASLQMLRDSLATLEKVTPRVRSLSADCSHFGVGYSIGIPLAFSTILGQKNVSGQSVWNRRMTLSHQVGIFWGSRSLVRKGSLSLGAGVEYSKMQFAAGAGQTSDTFDNAMDRDQDNYIAYLTGHNMEERATMHYLSIPLTLSVGQPYHDRVSGYFQLAIVPSFCVSSLLNVSGYYDLSGYYPQYQLTLSNFESLGFVSDNSIGQMDEALNVNRFLLAGRLAGGIYLPLCRTSQGETSPWVLKLGAKLDFSITPMAKGVHDKAPFQDATAHLNQNNFLASDGCRFLNPALEVGIMYIFGTKNLR